MTPRCHWSATRARVSVQLVCDQSATGYHQLPQCHEASAGFSTCACLDDALSRAVASKRPTRPTVTDLPVALTVSWQGSMFWEPPPHVHRH